MKDFQIFSDSSCDLPEELLARYHVIQIPFYISFDKKNYIKDQVDISTREFYDRMEDGKLFPVTSLPSTGDFLCRFRQAAEEGKNILCICLSARLSGSYQSALNAKAVLEEESPDTSVYVVNSFQATSGQGLILLQAAYMKEAGYTIDHINLRLQDLRRTGNLFFTVDSLDHLQRGGNMAKVSTLTGTFFNIRPILSLNEGDIQFHGTVQGRKRALYRLMDMLKEHFSHIDRHYKDFDFIITAGTYLGEARLLKAQVEEIIDCPIPYPIAFVGPTIGAHVGASSIGIAFIRKYDAPYQYNIY